MAATHRFGRTATAAATAALLAGCGVSTTGAAETAAAFDLFDAPASWTPRDEPTSRTLDAYCGPGAPECVETVQGFTVEDDPRTAVVDALAAQDGWTVTYAPDCETVDGWWVDTSPVAALVWSNDCVWEATVNETFVAVVSVASPQEGVRVSLRYANWRWSSDESRTHRAAQLQAAEPLVEAIEKVTVAGDYEEELDVSGSPADCLETECLKVHRRWRNVEGFDPRVDVARTLVEAGFEVDPYRPDDVCELAGPERGRVICTIVARGSHGAIYMWAAGGGESPARVAVFASVTPPDDD